MDHYISDKGREGRAAKKILQVWGRFEKGQDMTGKRVFFFVFLDVWCRGVWCKDGGAEGG